MVKIVGIQFQNNGKIHYFDACDMMMKPGDYVVADTAKGLDLGEVVIGIREVEEQRMMLIQNQMNSSSSIELA